jgi:hypothetical protein
MKKVGEPVHSVSSRIVLLKTETCLLVVAVSLLRPSAMVRDRKWTKAQLESDNVTKRHLAEEIQAGPPALRICVSPMFHHTTACAENRFVRLSQEDQDGREARECDEEVQGRFDQDF